MAICVNIYLCDVALLIMYESNVTLYTFKNENTNKQTLRDILVRYETALYIYIYIYRTLAVNSTIKCRPLLVSAIERGKRGVFRIAVPVNKRPLLEGYSAVYRRVR